MAAIWAAATYLNDKRLEYGKSFNEKEITLSFQTAETVAKLLTAETNQVRFVPTNDITFLRDQTLLVGRYFEDGRNLLLVYRRLRA